MKILSISDGVLILKFFLKLSKESINQIVSGLQDAAASGATVLPSRDLPTFYSSIHLTYNDIKILLNNIDACQLINNASTIL